jgi:hypothetical protein
MLLGIVPDRLFPLTSLAKKKGLKSRKNRNLKAKTTQQEYISRQVDYLQIPQASQLTHIF